MTWIISSFCSFFTCLNIYDNATFYSHSMLLCYMANPVGRAPATAPWLIPGPPVTIAENIWGLVPSLKTILPGDPFESGGNFNSENTLDSRHKVAVDANDCCGGGSGWFLWMCLFIYSCRVFPSQWSWLCEEPAAICRLGALAHLLRRVNRKAP